MKDNVFRKKLNDMGETAKADIEKSFGGEVKSGDELVSKFESMTSKARLKVMKKVGAGLLSLLILAGFTGCVNKKGDIEQGSNTTQVSLVDEGEISDITNKPNYTTETPTTKPSGGATSEKPTEPSTPERPTEPATPGSETTPATPEKPTEPATPGSETTPTTPEQPTEPVTPGTTTGEENPPAPSEYKYPAYFTELARKNLASALDNISTGETQKLAIYNTIKSITPEILLVERGKAVYENGLVREEADKIYFYAQYKINDKTTQNVKFEYEINNNEWRELGHSENFSSYSKWVDRVVEVMKEYCGVQKVTLSEIQNLDKLDANTCEKIAKFIDPKFVDVDLNHIVTKYIKEESGYERRYLIFNGFGYDKDGVSYTFTSELKDDDEIRETCGDYLTTPRFINNIQNNVFTPGILKKYTITHSSRVDSVFTRQAETKMTTINTKEND